MNILRTSRRPPRRRGFSLAELLISIGILSVGLSMAAAVFPTALKEYERSANNVLGNLICENGLAMGKVALRADDGSATNNPPCEVRDPPPSRLVNYSSSSVLGNNGNTYPSGDDNSPLGFFLFARKLGEAYQLVTVSYRKKGGGAVLARDVRCTIAGNGLTVTAVGHTDLRIGSPLVVRGNGEFAKLVDVNDAHTSGTLDRKLTPGSSLPCYVFRDSGSSNVSPALSALTTRTGLQK